MPVLVQPARFGGGGGATTNFLSLPGSSGSFCTTPDHASLDITTSFEVVTQKRMPDYTPATEKILFSKWDAAGQHSFFVEHETSGAYYFQGTTNGSTDTGVGPTATPASLTDGAVYWNRFRFRSTDRLISIERAANQSTEPGSWGTAYATTPGAAFVLHSGSSRFMIGGLGDGTYRPLQADIFQMLIRVPAAPIGGVIDWAGAPIVFSLDPGNWVSGSTWVTNTGHTMTLAGSATIGAE